MELLNDARLLRRRILGRHGDLGERSVDHGLRHNGTLQLDQSAASHDDASPVGEVEFDELAVGRDLYRALRLRFDGRCGCRRNDFEERILLVGNVCRGCPAGRNAIRLILRAGMYGRNAARLRGRSGLFEDRRGRLLRLGNPALPGTGHPGWLRKVGRRLGERIGQGIGSRIGGKVVGKLRAGPGGTRRDLLPEALDELLAAVDDDAAGRIDRIDEVAVDEDPHENPGRDQQDDRTESADAAAQQLGHADAESPAPPGRSAEAPTGAESDAQGERTEDHDHTEGENRMVDQQRPLADDAHTHQHEHDGHEDAEDAERRIDEPPPQPGAGTAAPVADRVAQEPAFLGRLAQNALVGLPAEKRRKERGGGEQTDAEQQQTDDPADAVAVAALDALSGTG